MNKKINCASYLRLSKEDIRNNDESSSISSQRMIIESFAKFNGFNIKKEYVDDGYSGGNFDRPGFQEMIKDIEAGLINCVITKDLSRLGREIYNTGSYIEQYFIEKNVRYIAINDSYDSTIGDSMLGIRLGVNDLYLRDISKKVLSSFKIKQEKGEYIGSIPCYGYIKDPADRHHLIIDYEAAKVVKRIYNYALKGYGMRTISNILTEEQIPIPIVYKKESRGLLVTENDGYGVWKHGTIKNILTSQMYIGNMVQHTYKKQSYRSNRNIKLPEEEHIIIENTHEPIIDKETFDKVQEILKSRHTCTVTKEHKYLFAGIIKCKECGHTLSISEKINKKTNSHFTECNLWKRKGKYSGCQPHRLNYNLLEEELISSLRNICKNFLIDFDYDSVIKNKIQNNNKKINDINKELLNREVALNKVNSMINSLYSDKIEGILTERDFVRIYKEKSEEARNISVRIEELKAELLEIEEDKNNDRYKECKELIDDFIRLKKPTRTILKRLIDRVEISNENEINVYFNFKEMSLNNCKA